MSWKTTGLIVTLALAPHSAGAADVVVPPAVPANLEVPAGHEAYFIGHASGTQAYICLPSGKGVAWTFYGPQATVFDEAAEQAMTHFLSPNPAENGALRATWQDSRDTSAVWAVAIANSTDPNFVSSGSIAWLLLDVVGDQYGPTGGDRLSQTTYIQRVNTAGGVAPATGCNAPKDAGKRALVPYTTDYVFYR